MFHCMFEALADAAGYKVSAIGLTPPGSPASPFLWVYFRLKSGTTD